MTHAAARMPVSHCQTETSEDTVSSTAAVSTGSGTLFAMSPASRSGRGKSGVPMTPCPCMLLPGGSVTTVATCTCRSGRTAYSRVCVSVFHQGRETSGKVYSPACAGMMAFFCCLAAVMPPADFVFSNTGISGYCLKPPGSDSGISGNWLDVRPCAVSVRVRVTGSSGNNSSGFFDHSSVIFTSVAGSQCPPR